VDMQGACFQGRRLSRCMDVHGWEKELTCSTHSPWYSICLSRYDWKTKLMIPQAPFQDGEYDEVIEVNSDAKYKAHDITHCSPSSPSLPYYTTKQIFLYKVHLSIYSETVRHSTILLLVHPPLYMSTRKN